MQLWAFSEKDICIPRHPVPPKQTSLEDRLSLPHRPWLFSSPPSGSKRRLIMSTSFVQAEKLRPTAFEVEYFDQYDFYSLTDRYSGGSSRKGRSKKEAEDHTNRPNPGGHERKIVLKLQRTEQKRKATTSKK